MHTEPTSPQVETDKSLNSEVPEPVVDNIRQALRGLQFGEITITVRNGSVTQIERIARKRQFKSRQHDY